MVVLGAQRLEIYRISHQESFLGWHQPWQGQLVGRSWTKLQLHLRTLGQASCSGHCCSQKKGSTHALFSRNQIASAGKKLLIHGYVYLPPWGVEFNEEVFVLGQLLIEVRVGENHNAVIHFDGGSTPEVEDGGENTE